MDCEGHGTSVAAVAAGPDRSRAAGHASSPLKIVKGNELRRGPGLRHPGRHRLGRHEPGDLFDIATINLSFGGAPTDGLAHGYCDDVYAAVRRRPSTRPTRPGSSSSSLAGNEGADERDRGAGLHLRTRSRSAPSIRTTFASVAWSDDSAGTLCEDSSVAPDTIVCFSNSASNLSLLAPGAFWLVVTRGGAEEYFHGTSAAAPAVAGAAALMRQAHPELSPSGIASLLQDDRPHDRRPAQRDRDAAPRHAGRRPGSSGERSGPTPATPLPCPTGPARRSRRRRSRASPARSPASRPWSRSSTTIPGSSGSR